ncbi:DUF2147 domain-containing protein [Bradyrhizobium sp. MOS002]|uniref:DUF2147 domain-containing protein n=1 Tax=Bradyrhizobium sp. MOS002 TaxID=2133947 RepID=UPI000D1156F9|nr:DUF2147 domain-containing protein [Bradyrhizobium sp. MOS002]PSO29795.1 DUF2147 domain-containing protein [Bradyrhizobium sp. MOS002]
MRKLLATAAFLLASTAAQAQYTFDYGGRTIRIDPDRGTVQIPGVYDNTGQGKAKKAKNDAKGAPKADPQAPQQAKADPQPPANPAPAPVTAPPAAEQTPVQAPVQAPVAVAPPAPPAPPATTANNAPAEEALVPPPQPAPSAAPTVAAVPPAPPPPPAPTIAAAPPAPSPPPVPAPAPAPVQSAAVAPPAPATAATRDLNSPLGVWLTEEKEGKVRIEQCGSNLCGYSVDSKSNQNGEQVLINMKPGKDQNKDQKWSGRILDPNSGSTYDSTIALKGTDRLRVQGCAFGGMFCGGQTWTRVN